MKDAPNDQHAHNKDEPETFTRIGVFAARVLMKTYQVGNERKDGADDTEPEQRRERAQEAQREYVEQRERDLCEFERQARGEWRRPRRGPAGRVTK